jgi:LemA protein
MITWAIALIVVLIVGWLIVLFNSLVRLSNRADGAWADIEVQLKRRYDLVPSLVEVVQGYAAHERGTFEAVAAARTAAMGACSPAEKTQTEPSLVAGLRSIFALAEAYPRLKANEEFLNLQGHLAQIEDTVQNARRYYNAVVRDLNTQLQLFPNSMAAPLLGVQPREYFQLDNAGEAQAVNVNFEGNT